jgi:predicted AAA+ superfamily ATPase
LVEKLRAKLDQNRFVMLCSPPATGKTALCQMLVHKYNLEHKIISCRRGKIPSDEFATAGINLAKLEAEPRDNLYVIVLDDAQKIYKFDDFWSILIKGVWIPSNYVFIVCATSILNSGTDTPIELQSAPRLSRDDFYLRTF